MKRGDIVILAARGPYTGKPRPALIVQSDLFHETESITICPLTSTLVDVPLGRITVEPSRPNGLKNICQIMIDKIYTVPNASIGKRIGHLDADMMVQVERSLALFLGIG